MEITGNERSRTVQNLGGGLRIHGAHRKTRTNTYSLTLKEGYISSGAADISHI